jgi:hypothetical protein
MITTRGCRRGMGKCAVELRHLGLGGGASTM